MSQARSPTGTSVDLSTDSSLEIDISDALSEKDKVKFTVHTKVSYPGAVCASLRCFDLCTSNILFVH